jgi:hypothetical protein
LPLNHSNGTCTCKLTSDGLLDYGHKHGCRRANLSAVPRQLRMIKLREACTRKGIAEFTRSFCRFPMLAIACTYGLQRLIQSMMAAGSQSAAQSTLSSHIKHLVTLCSIVTKASRPEVDVTIVKDTPVKLFSRAYIQGTWRHAIHTILLDACIMIFVTFACNNVYQLLMQWYCTSFIQCIFTQTYTCIHTPYIHPSSLSLQRLRPANNVSLLCVCAQAN